MSGLRSDMSEIGRICLTWGRICSVTKNFEQQKSRSGAKIMGLGPDKRTISKLDNIELRKITGTTISNLNSRNQNLGLGKTLSKNKLEQEHEVNRNERHKDTRFLSEVRPPTKDTYVSVVELIKSHVSFNPNPL
jgi:hypothetical protein